jgi:hypothetical protein
MNQREKVREEKVSMSGEVVSRRRFATRFVAAAALLLVPAEADAAGEARKIAASGGALGARPADLSVADWDEVHARYANLLHVYGTRMTEAEKHRAGLILTTNQHMLASIRTFEVQNSDPSACTLRLYEPEPRV